MVVLVEPQDVVVPGSVVVGAADVDAEACVVVVATAVHTRLASVQSPLEYSWEVVLITTAYPFHSHRVTA